MLWRRVEVGQRGGRHVDTLTEARRSLFDFDLGEAARIKGSLSVRRPEKKWLW